MTAVGLVMFLVGVIGANVLDGPRGLSDWAVLVCGLLLVSGIGLVLAGVVKFLWQVMP